MEDVRYPYLEIQERDNYTCQYCGRDGSKDFESYLSAGLTIDHIKPRKYGGTSHPSNLVVACHVCNKLKGARDCNSIEEARQIVEKQREATREWYDKNIRRNK